MTKPFFPYASQSILDEDCKAVQAALKDPMITRGPQVKQFEETVAAFCGAPYAVAFNSGSAALAAAYFAAGLNAHDRVFSSPNTFIASVASPLQKEIKPVFVDIDRASGSMDLAKLDLLLNFRSTRGRPFIIPVHFAGIAVDMRALDALLRHPDAVVIEDAAHAIGSSYPTGEKVGSCAYSQMTIFSFHPAKTITTGEGGMVTTRDPALYHRLQLFRNNGIEREGPFLSKEPAAGYYEVHEITGNYHMTSFQAALGLSQFKRLDSFTSRRRTLVERYRGMLGSHPHIRFLSDAQAERTAFHLFVVQIDFDTCKISRQRLMEELKERGIGSEVHYIPLYCHPALKCNVSSEKEQCPQTDAYYQQALTLPLYYDLQEEQVDFICKELLSLLSNGA